MSNEGRGYNGVEISTYIESLNEGELSSSASVHFVVGSHGHFVVESVARELDAWIGGLSALSVALGILKLEGEGPGL